MDFKLDPLTQIPDPPPQRARGEIRAAFARAGARSEASRIFETGGLRLRFPRAGAECEAVIVNTGGGIAGGDLARIELAVASGAEVFATTQAAEKVYRADGALVARLLSPSPVRLRTAAIAAMRTLRGREPPRLWL